ncbi:MAG TPA: cation:proton antiporter [Terriglobia bacterium]|nr:cation:proton antiporter [Terriglobia bacterium]
MPNLGILILQIGVIIGASRLVAVLFQKFRQPKVMGEMFAGIMLGPSLLGWAAPHLSASLFPPSSLGYLNALSQVGVVIYMFLVGVALNPKSLREHGHTAVLASHVSIIVPFLLGAALALLLYPRFCDDSIGFTGFALFMGAAMSITAFPVLARILTDRGMVGTKLGSLAIACAAVDDVTGWCILAYIVVLVRVGGHASTPLWITVSGLVVFLLFMVYGARRLLRRFGVACRETGQLSENALALLIVVVLASAVITEHLGLHLVFGAFLAGVIMPKGKKFVRYIFDKFETPTVVVLLPLYFAFTGLRTSVRVISDSQMCFFCLIIILVAVAGKLGGSMVAARAAGSAWREAAGLGILMNARGLMELVILNVGLDIGVISPSLYSIMVVMALVTTFMTTPLLEWVYPLRLVREEISELAQDELNYQPAAGHVTL